MVRHRASLRQRTRTWWDEKSINPLFLPLVWVVLSALLLIGLALTVPPIIDNILEPDEPKVTQTPSPTPTPVSSPEPTQEPAPVPELPPAGPAPQFVPQPVAPQPQPQPQPVPVQPVQPPAVPHLPQLPPVVPVDPLPTLPNLPDVVQPVIPPILQPPLRDTLGTVGGVADEVLKGIGKVLP